MSIAAGKCCKPNQMGEGNGDGGGGSQSLGRCGVTGQTVGGGGGGYRNAEGGPSGYISSLSTSTGMGTNAQILLCCFIHTVLLLSLNSEFSAY
jgi:hypothetical protein